MLMRRLGMAGLMAVWLGAANLGWGADKGIAVVSMAKLLEAYPETRTANELLDSQRKEFEAEHKELMANREKLKKDFEEARDKAKDKALNDEARTKQIGVAEQRLEDLKEFEMKIRETAMSRQKQLEDQKVRATRRIVGKLRDLVKAFADEKGYTLVLDSSGITLSGVEAVAYAAASIDITEAMVKIVAKDSGGAQDKVKGDEKKD